MAHDLGDPVRVYTSTPFQDQDTQTPFDPTVVEFIVKDPTGAEVKYTYGTDPEVVRYGVGQYHMILRPSVAGTWKFRVQGFTGGLTMGAAEGGFDVAPPQVSIDPV